MLNKTNEIEHHIINTFLENLATRKYSENDLSDIIYTCCYTSMLFKEYFIHFFFPEIQEIEGIYIYREFPKGNSRVDFFFEYEGNNYIIENKIYDRSQHFGVYDRKYLVSPRRFGYIMNYEIFEWKGKTKRDYQKLGYRIHSWEEFFYYLKKQKNQDEITQAVLQYVKKVCSIIQISTPMNISALTALPTFLKMLEKIFNTETDDYVSYYYGKNCMQETNWGGNICDPHDNCVVGRYFETKFKKQKGCYNTIWGWMGVYFNDPEYKPCICIGIRKDKNWGGKAYELLTQNIPETSEWYEENGVVWRELSEKKFSALEQCQQLSKQQKILQDFYSSSMDLIATLISKNL